MKLTCKKMLLVIPMKDPAEAKSRLGSGLDADQRRSLAISLFERVVQRVREVLDAMPAAQRQKRQIDLAVVSASEQVRLFCEPLGLALIPEVSSAGLSQAVTDAAIFAQDAGYDHVCILPGDLADPKTADLALLLTYPLGAQTCLLCPSMDMGTNALIVPLPSPIPFCYGEKSFYSHYRSLADAGMIPVVLPLDSLQKDVDTLKDLQYLPASQPGMNSGGGARR